MGEIQVEFQAPGQYEIDLTCTDQDGNPYLLTDTVDVYYVRREMRELTDADRDRYLDTFLLLSKVSGEEGRAKYGEHYHDLDYFVALHLNAASKRSHDHIHDGLGVVTQHVALTQSLECALQSVHPALTVPYWDYTIDSYKSKLMVSYGVEVGVSACVCLGGGGTSGSPHALRPCLITRARTSLTHSPTTLHPLLSTVALTDRSSKTRSCGAPCGLATPRPTSSTSPTVDGPTRKSRCSTSRTLARTTRRTATCARRGTSTRLRS